MDIENKQPSIPILSLFSGGGFLDLGFINQGFSIQETVEIEPAFIECYNHAVKGYIKHLNEVQNNPYGIKFEPILKPIDASDHFQQKRLGRKHFGITGIIGGPPCQDYSVGGKNAGIKGDRGKLINSYFKIVKNVKPEFLFFENVDGLFTTKKHKKVFLSLVRRLGLIGYKVYYDILNALDYGIPQDRPRLTMVAFRRPIINTLKKAGFRNVNKKELLKYKGDEEYIFKWPTISCPNAKEQSWPDTWEFGSPILEDIVDQIPKNYHCLTVINAWKGINGNTPNQQDQFSPRSDKFQTTSEGYVKCKSFKRLHRFRYSPTTCYGNNEVHLHPTEPRRISVREALRIQSVPDEYIFPEDTFLTNMFKIISNGVPTKKAELIAKEIRRTLINYYIITGKVNGYLDQKKEKRSHVKNPVKEHKTGTVDAFIIT